MGNGEIIIYQVDENSSFQIEVRVENDSVWINRHQMVLLFGRDIKTIGKHIGNALKEELNDFSVVANFATTASDGKTYQVEHYNLDVIISVGYRVKSQRGILFRIWANKVLKEYLLKGYAVNQRIEKIEKEIRLLKSKAGEFDFHIRTSLPPHEGIFYDGQIFDAYYFVSGLIKLAKFSIVLIDNYVDESVLMLMAKRGRKVKATIFTSHNTKLLQLDLLKHNTQYQPVLIKEFSQSHDRFLIIDDKTVYHIGASLKDLGRKWFAFSKIDLDASEMIKKLSVENKG